MSTGSSEEAENRRAQMLAAWEDVSGAWGEAADRLRDWGMPVSVWMVEHLDLQPGERVLELAAGPGDTGFMAAELVAPGGTLICSDATEGMLAVARRRATAMGVENVEFAQLQLEWIDRPTASCDAILCRWGVMLIVDPAAALSEMRRVLRPGGRCALAVWDGPAANPWAAIPGRALIDLGLTDPPDPSGPGMFALAAPGQLGELLEAAGFVEVEVAAVELQRQTPDVDAYLAETAQMSMVFGRVWEELSEETRGQVRARVAELAGPFTSADGQLTLPGRSHVALAHA